MKDIAVKYISAFGDHSGYAEAARQTIFSLNKAQIPLTTARTSFVRESADYGEALKIAERLEGKPIDYQAVIIHLTPDLYLNYLEPNKHHIGVLVWETDKLPNNWSWFCNRLDEIWTRSPETKKILVKSGVRVPIYVFPEPIVEVKPEDYEPFIIPNHRGFLFYSIFEWTKRKNPEALLTAYWKEFEGDQDVSLLLKTFRDNYTFQMHQKVKGWINELKQGSGIKKFPRILYSSDLLTNEETWRLHVTGDCFVSAHRGEGWGRPQMEAMMMGKPIISTNYGGIHEYLNETNAYLTNYNLTPVTQEDDRPYYTPNQNWADVDITDLRGKMRFVYDNRDKAMEVGQIARNFVIENFNSDKVGGMMRKRLMKIAETL
jgi:glycosyltransferase involved in cell wall biosynthesis